MVCIYCGHTTQVSNSRLQRRLNQVWRRRGCAACGNTFTTHEKPDWHSALVVRYTPKDIQSFDRDVLFVSLYECCKHRPQAIADADGLTQTIISKLRPYITAGAVERQQIIAVAQATLERFDTTALTVYNAYHKA